MFIPGTNKPKAMNEESPLSMAGQMLGGRPSGYDLTPAGTNIQEPGGGVASSGPEPEADSDSDPHPDLCCCVCRCCGDKMPQQRRSAIRLFLLVFFMMLYLLVGSVIFSALEAPNENKLKEDLRRTRADFLASHQCLADAELESFIVEVIEANNRGVSAIGNVSSEPNWSFGQSLFFAGTILTTIGYGHVTPLSEGGKVFCIVYAAIGIPLTLIMFTALVERLMLVTNRILQALIERLGHIYQVFHIRLLHLFLILFVLIVFVLLIPSAIFTVIEDDWNYLDSFYYCFISMTTIGLGDYIPGDNAHQLHRPLYKICTTFYLFVGLVMMMLLLANIYDVPELNIGYHFYLRSDQEEPGERRQLNSSETGPKYSEQVNKAYSDDVSGSARGSDERAQLTSK